MITHSSRQRYSILASRQSRSSLMAPGSSIADVSSGLRVADPSGSSGLRVAHTRDSCGLGAASS
eukprot:552102-Rhodomonas_salina.2